MKRFYKLLRILGYIAAGILLVVIAVALYTRTDMFRNQLRATLMAEVEKIFNGKVYIGTIRGSLVRGFETDSIALQIDNEEFIETGRAIFSYGFLSALRGKYVLKTVALVEPRIHLHSNRKGMWNIGKLLSSDTTGGPASTYLNFQNLVISNGELFIVDSAALLSPSHFHDSAHVEYHNIHLQNVNLNFSGLIDRTTYEANIENLSCELEQPPISLTQLSGKFFASPAALHADGVELQTEKTKISLSARLDSVNIFSPLACDTLNNKKISLSLYSLNTNCNEVALFIPTLSFLDGSVAIDTRLSGTLGDIKLEKLSIGVAESALELIGEVQYLTQPESLNINATILNASLFPEDPAALLPEFSLPVFSEIGTMKFNGIFRGAPNNFSTKLNIETEQGNLQTDVHIDVRTPQMKYDGTIIASALDVYSFTAAFDSRDDSDSTVAAIPHTNLNFSAEINGEGIALDSLHATLHCRVDSTFVVQRNYEEPLAIRSAAVDITARYGAISLESNFALNAGSGNLRAETQFTGNALSSVSAEGTFTHLNPGLMLNDEKYSGDISLLFRANMRGTSFATISGNCNVHFLPSSFLGKSFGADNDSSHATDVEFLLQQGEAEKNIARLRSPLLDAEAEGQFDLQSLPKIFLAQLSAVGESFSSGKPVPCNEISAHPLRITYRCEAKNLEPLQFFVPNMAFVFVGEMKGTMEIIGDEIIHTGASEVHDALFQQWNVENNSDTLYATSLHNASLTYEFISSIRENNLIKTRAHISTNIETATYQGTRLDSILLQSRFANNTGLFSLSIIANEQYKFVTDGRMFLDDNHSSFSCAPLSFIRGKWNWQSRDTVRFAVHPSLITFSPSVLQRDSQRVDFSGELRNGRELNFDVVVKNFVIEEIPYITSFDDSVKKDENFRGNINATAKLSGTLREPILRAAAISENLSFRDYVFGRLLFDGSYAEKNLSAHGEFTSTDSLHPMRFSAEGNLPLDLAFASVQERFPDDTMNLKILSNNTPLALFDPFIPRFDNISGTAICSLEIGGTTLQPDYQGTIKIRNGVFQYEDNKLWYSFAGTLFGEKKKIRLAEFTLANSSADRNDGLVSLGGYFTLRGITIDSLNVSARGQLLVLKSTVRQTKGAYGNLFCSTDMAGIIYRGTFEKSFLGGTLFLNDADVTFPPLREQAGNETNIIPIITIDDTSKIKPVLPLIFPEKQQVRQTEGRIVAKTFGETVLDGLTMDLTVETRGTNQLKMIFGTNPTTNDELYSELTGKLFLRKTNEGIRLLGEIDIGQQSYYNFFKRFAATGKMKFIGDVQNPELEISAVHEGIHTTFDSINNVENDKKILVILTITGTRFEPKIAMSMKELSGADTLDFATQGKDPQSDAISFLITGKFRDELTSGERSQLVADVGSSVGSSVVTGFTSSLVSGIMTDFLRNEFGFIRSAEISYTGGNVTDKADVRLSGELFNAYWRFGGRIFNDIGRANISFQVPLGEVLKTKSLNNLFIEVERKVEDDHFSTERKLTNYARLFYKFSY